MSALDDLVKAARAAGFKGQALVTAVAIAMAESNGNPKDIGDINLSEPGEKSVGAWQINYRPSRDVVAGKTNPVRDPTKNLDLLNNAKAAYIISGGGTNFRPWSTYTSSPSSPRNYTHWLPVARVAVNSSGGSVLDTIGSAITDPFGTAGAAGSAVLNGVTGAIGGVFSGWAADAFKIGLTIVLVGGGVGLIVIGATRLAGASKSVQTVQQTAPLAAAAV